MGCAQTKHSVNSPAGGVEKLKLDNGYAGIDGFVAHRRSVGQRRFVGRESSEAERPHGGGNDQFGSDNSELVDGWPKWLTSNIPKHVLAGLVPKSVEAYDKLDKVVFVYFCLKSGVPWFLIVGLLQLSSLKLDSLY